MPRKSKQLALIEDAESGPAMQALGSEQRRKFVLAKVFQAASDTEAARMAGYGRGNSQHAQRHAWTLMRDPKVQDAILEVGRCLMRSEGPKSIFTLVAIRDDPMQPATARVKCATELLARSGFVTTTAVNHEHTIHLTADQADAEILRLAAEVGLPPEEARKLLVKPEGAIELEQDNSGTFVPKELSTHPSSVSSRESYARKKAAGPKWEADKARRRKQLSEETKAIMAAAKAREAAEVDGEQY
jgi:hypothetical protein